jgi:8-oxo-dGTP diphosphatase
MNGNRVQRHCSRRYTTTFISSLTALSMKHYEVVAAVVLHQGKILCVQKGAGKYDYVSRKYEFPGGKVEQGETEEEALTREIKEELELAITVDSKLITVDHQYPDFHISMHTYLCSCQSSIISLSEHIDYKWLFWTELNSLDWAAADIPIVRFLETNLS